jgi:hypothetical protein
MGDEDDEHWREFFALWSRVSITGERISGPIMRRKIGGRWEYRRMSDDEASDHASDDAW